MTTVTLNLSEQTAQRARHAAEVLQRPLNDLLAEMLEAILPTVEDAPLDMQVELTRMTWFDNQHLWEIAHSFMSVDQQTRMMELAQLQEQHPLATAEQSELEGLRYEYGRAMVRKARAYALLSLRSGKPLLAQG